MKKVLFFIISTLSVVGCNSGISGSTADVNSNNLSNQSAGNGSQFERVDVWNLFQNQESGIVKNDPPVCNDKLCISTDTTTTTYAQGMSGQDYFVRKSIGSNVKVVFNANGLKNFRLSDVYSDNNQNGHLSQVVTDECDNLVASSGGNLAGKSCKIHVLYTADAVNSQEIINYSFKWDGGQMVFPVRYIAQRVSDQNVPILSADSNIETDDIMALYSGVIENGFNSGLEYDQAINQIGLSNNGSDAIAAQMPNPTISVKLANKSSSYDFDSMFVQNSLFTSCNGSSVEVGGNCNFGFNFVPNVSADGSLNSQVGLFDFSYMQRSQKQDYVKRFYLSLGDFNPRSIDVQIDPTVSDYVVSPSFDLTKIPTSSNGTIAYLTGNSSTVGEKSPVTIQVKYQPQFNVARNVGDKTISYGVGDYGSANFNPQSLLDKITFNVNKDCINSGFNMDYDDQLNGHSCNVAINLQNLSQDEKNAIMAKPVGGLLIASYYSPLANRVINQIIGPINFHGKTTFSTSMNNADLKIHVNWNSTDLSAEKNPKLINGGKIITANKAIVGYDKSGDFIQAINGVERTPNPQGHDDIAQRFLIRTGTASESSLGADWFYSNYFATGLLKTEKFAFNSNIQVQDIKKETDNQVIYDRLEVPVAFAYGTDDAGRHKWVAGIINTKAGSSGKILIADTLYVKATKNHTIVDKITGNSTSSSEDYCFEIKQTDEQFFFRPIGGGGGCDNVQAQLSSNAGKITSNKDVSGYSLSSMIRGIAGVHPLGSLEKYVYTVGPETRNPVMEYAINKYSQNSYGAMKHLGTYVYAGSMDVRQPFYATPNAVAVNPDNTALFIVDKNHNISSFKISEESNTIEKTFTLHDANEQVAVAADKDVLYTAGNAQINYYAIDHNTFQLKLINHMNTADNVSSIALDSVGHRLFVGLQTGWINIYSIYTDGSLHYMDHENIGFNTPVLAMSVDDFGVGRLYVSYKVNYDLKLSEFSIDGNGYHLTKNSSYDSAPGPFSSMCGTMASGMTILGKYLNLPSCNPLNFDQYIINDQVN